MKTEPEAVLKAAVKRYFPDVALVTTFTAEDAALIEMVACLEPRVRIFWLDGLVRNPEAAAMAEAVRARHGVEVVRVRAALLPVERLVAQQGLRALVTGGEGPAVKRRRGLVVVRPLAGVATAVA